jgi:hypothetical protein
MASSIVHEYQVHEWQDVWSAQDFCSNINTWQDFNEEAFQTLAQYCMRDVNDARKATEPERPSSAALAIASTLNLDDEQPRPLFDLRRSNGNRRFPHASRGFESCTKGPHGIAFAFDLSASHGLNIRQLCMQVKYNVPFHSVTTSMKKSTRTIKHYKPFQNADTKSIKIKIIRVRKNPKVVNMQEQGVRATRGNSYVCACCKKATDLIQPRARMVNGKLHMFCNTCGLRVGKSNGVMCLTEDCHVSFPPCNYALMLRNLSIICLYRTFPHYQIWGRRMTTRMKIRR